MRRTVIVGLLVAIGAAAGAWWWFTRAERAPKPLALYGNVDLRQVQLAFNNSERISAVVAQEGDRVRRGQVLARLDQSRLEPRVLQAAAQVAAQWQVVERLHHGNRPEEIAQARAQVAAQRSIVERLRNGSRPEEIAQARANVMAAQAEVVNARRRYQRLKSLSAVRLPDQSQVQAVSQEDLDDARAALDEAEAKLTVTGRRWSWPSPVHARRKSPRARRGWHSTGRRWSWPSPAHARKTSPRPRPNCGATRRNWRF